MSIHHNNCKFSLNTIANEYVIHFVHCKPRLHYIYIKKISVTTITHILNKLLSITIALYNTNTRDQSHLLIKG